jgi:hypothetical protein
MGDEIDYAVEELRDGKRYMRIRRRSGKEEYQRVPDSDRPFLLVPNLGDVDDIALRDISQEVQETPTRERENKPDIQKEYDEFRENRRRELSGRRYYGMWPRKKDR